MVPVIPTHFKNFELPIKSDSLSGDIIYHSKSGLHIQTN